MGNEAQVFMIYGNTLKTKVKYITVKPKMYYIYNTSGKCLLPVL